ncbi:filamentous hemagglutinin N-terminal domain-containing protein [Dyella dinghuensis]|uniref:Filamentous hemagglutinin N-terminal domain-containing protein n=1 Tax=Dyella dinghuensis TaxID=1920169 RepID=A0A3S0S2R6_9GAMM|nr:filamentous haemagglutinin family protein [Dyella dinghuensis]RUL63080.1 filamentous hemagglutinin N-terminal domain-containing protein [Dyella dinghuensis]
MITPGNSGQYSRSVKRAIGARHPLAFAIASVLALTAITARAAPPPLSQAWLAQQHNQAVSQQNSTGSPSTSGIAPQSPAQLLQNQNVQQSIANLNRAAQAVAAQMASQQAAQQAAQQQPSPVPNGLTPGGLVVAPGVGSDPSLWQNANLPTQTTSNGQTTVQVKQTAQKAILTWSSFNVGTNTELYFNQSGGNQTNGSNNNWIVLNRVIDPSGVPSQIFGQIKAEGTVYLLNHNGILFGAGSQVNTQSLIASSLDLFSSDIATSNSDFLNGGINAVQNNVPFLANGIFTDGKNHDVVVQDGASITGGTQGFVLLAAPNVANAGSIVDDQGQVILAAGVAFTNANGTSTTQPLSVVNALGATSNYPGGTATNTGLLQSRRGEVEMDGYNVTQNGVALASTSINYAGSIVLNAQDQWNGSEYVRGGTLTLGPNSITTVLPEQDGSTTTSTAAATAAFEQSDSKLTLSGQTVTFQSGSLLEAPSANLVINAYPATSAYSGDDYANPQTGRLYIDNGTVIDVSGLADVELPMSALLVTIPLVGQNELANSPLLRNSFLYHTADLTVDSTQSGTTANGLAWVGSPILNVSGYVDDVPRTVNQLMTNGGTISLDGAQVIVRSGAELNLDGGYVAYQPGWITTPNVLASNGQIYNIADANPNLTYVGFAGDYEVVDNRWGITTNYSNPLLAGTTRWDNGFAVGGNAGTLNIATGDALVLDGQISAQAFAGRNQVAQGAQPSGGTLDVSAFSTQTASGSLASLSYLLQPSVTSLDQLDPGFQAATPWSNVLANEDPAGTNPYDLARWLPISANLVQQGGFSTLDLNFNAPDAFGGLGHGEILEPAGTVLAVQPGGSIQFAANAINVLGELSAPSGAITLTASGGPITDPASATGATLPQDITIGSGAVLSTAGLWVNDAGTNATNYIGERYINGGSISLIDEQYAFASGGAGGAPTDETGSIVLQSGSLLDVSSGGYVNSNGQLQLTNGVPDGSGGNISLIDYANQGDNTFITAPSSLGQGKLVLDGSLRAYGFSGGGTLALQAIDIQIGGNTSNLAMSNGLYLSPSFFAGQGFDNYALTSITDATIAPGAVVQISRDNLLPNVPALLAAPTGTNIYGESPLTDSAYVSVGQLAPYLQYISRGTNGPGFSLSAGQYLGWSTGAGQPGPVYPDVTGSVTLNAGAVISAGAGASIALAGTQSTIVNGTIDAPGGSIDLSTTPLTAMPFNSLPEVWLGPQADINAAGVSLINPLAAAVPSDGTGLGLVARYTPRAGAVLDGGSVSLTSNEGYVVTQQGSVIDVSGSSDVYDLPSANGASNGAQTGYVPTPVWSDAGSIVLDAAAGLYADGSLRAQGGSSQAEGGSLQITGMQAPNNFYVPTSTAIVLQQSGLLVPGSGLQPGGIAPPAAATGVLYFALDRLNDSGITSLTLGPDASIANSAGYKSVPVGFAGDVDLSLGKSFEVYAPTLTALPAGSKDLSGVSTTAYNVGDGTVQINAPYVEMTGNLAGTGASFAGSPVAGSGTLDIDAGFMDIGGQLNLQGWANTSLTASDAIRFYEPTATGNLYNSTGGVIPGLLFSTGNITLQAAELYPVTNYAFAVDANASGLSNAQGQALSTTLTILGNGVASMPLSAGGSLLLDASNIVQNGTVWVPSGNLLIGVKDTTATSTSFGLAAIGINLNLVRTQNVTLGAGSLTSVSLDGETVPYGSTTDGQQWNYAGDPLYAVSPLTAPPAKSITITGNDVSLNSGATIDISGGGTLQASEWVPGTGGSVNVLTQYETSYANGSTGTQVPQYTDGRAIYAILPGYNAPVGAQDAAMTNAAGAGAGPAVGESVYLSGIAGLPAGYYTLLPAGYATLPGAYRVVQDTSSQNAVLGQNAVLPDGTLAITGYFGNALDGAHQSTNTTFLVQSSSVWQQYSQYTFTNADSYFTAQAASNGTVAPSLPADGGHLILSATQQLQLGATLDNAPASDGRPGMVDIASQAIQVVGADSTPMAGYVQLSADQLTALGAGSLLLGGTRQLTSNGYQIDSSADSVVLSNDSADPLQGQEILLVANGSGDGISLQSGSYIAATGSGVANTTPLLFGSNANATSGTAAVSGSGALLRVSQDGIAQVTRYDVSGSTSGNLTVDAGATVQGGNSLTMDTTGVTSVDPNAIFTAQNIQATANQISFIGSGASAAGIGGLVIGPGTLSLFNNASQVTLSSRGAIDFLGNVSIDLPQTLDLNANAYESDGGTVSIKAATLGLGNAIGGGSATAAAGSGQLTLDANELDFTVGNSVTQGFGNITANVSQGMTGQDIGGVNFGAANVSFNTPIILAASGGDTALTTTGSFAINAANGTALADNNMGGTLSLSGGSLSVGTQVDALAGKLSLTATSGDVTLGSGANVDAAGVNKTFYDVTTYAPGGDLALVSNQGSVIVDTGAVVNFAGAPLGGTAGNLTIFANNLATLNGSFEGGAASGYKGGYFTLSSGGALNLDQLAQLIHNAGANGGIAIASGAGNLVLSAGQSLVAQDVYLTANGGGGAVDPNNGVVDIEGTINVSGNAAGEIELYGRNGVTVNGSLLATSSVPDQMGGIVQIGTIGTADGTLNPTYGYENVQPGSAGSIVFGPNAVINVTGGSPGVGGIVSLRAPLLTNGDVPITFANNASIVGANNVTIVPYAVWSTDDPNTNAAQHFDGLIDPAGWYSAGPGGTPQMVAGTWYDAAGNTLTAPTSAAMLQTYLSNDYFVPTSANAAHQDFYGYVGGNTADPGTLMSYVEQPGYIFGNRYAGIANLQISPGIELINPDASINGGDISVLTNWNLGAGVTAADGTIQLAYRYGANPSISASGTAPTLTLRALQNVDVDASITDGFYQQNSGAAIAAPVLQQSGSGGDNPLYDADLALYNNTINFLENDNLADQNGAGPWYLWNGGLTFFWDPNTGGIGTSPTDITALSGPNSAYPNSPNFYQPINAPLAGQSNAYYANYQTYIQTVGAGQAGTWSNDYNQGDWAAFLPYNLTSLPWPQISAYPTYAAYVSAYQQWLTSNFTSANDNPFSMPLSQLQTPAPILSPLQSEASGNYTQYSGDYGTYITGFDAYYNYVFNNLGNTGGYGPEFFYAPFAPVSAAAVTPQVANNSPSNMPSLGNPASLASATLLGGSSSSYQLVAGANFASANPLAVVANTSAGNVNLDGHFAAQYTANGGNGETLEFPTVVRTGTGSIDIVAAGDIDWQDSTAPAAIYTAGAPAAGTTAGTGVTPEVFPSFDGPLPDLLVNGLVTPANAGNVLLSAGGNINAIEQVYDTTGNITGTPGTLVSQFWWPWLETGNNVNSVNGTLVTTGTSINFANFDQGVMSVGGNVTVNAGGNISNLSVSLPTTWYANATNTSITTVGGGNLNVNAGGDILSGSYFVAKGTGSLSADGSIGSDFTYVLPSGSVSATGASLSGATMPASTLLALQDAQWNVQARDGVNIGAILDPSYIDPAGIVSDEQSYSTSSAVKATTVSGDVTLGSLTWETQLFNAQTPNDLGVLPSTLDFAALNGNINVLTAGGLYPSATGNLNLIAGNSVYFAQENYSLDGTFQGATDGFGLIDANASVLPSPLQPQGSANSTLYPYISSILYLDNLPTANGNGDESLLHQAGLHDDDTTPARIYALNGSIIDGTQAPNGIQMDEMLIEPDKPALIYAGNSIVDLSFIGQQTHASDITRIAAGGSIYDTEYTGSGPLSLFAPTALNYQLVPVIELSGVGTLDVQAGRNIGPFTSQTDLLNANSNEGSPTGIETVGNALNLYLPHDGANIDVSFGVAPGIDTSNFLTQYLSNPSDVDGFGSLLPDLVTFMEQQQDGQVVDTGFAQDQRNIVLTTQQAESAFQQLPSYVQQQFVQQEFFKLLAQVGADYNEPSSSYYHQYARGYAAISSLFPASFGYTDNGTGAGGLNGEAKTVDTGDLDIRSSTIQTQQGGNINILGPGGQALIGSVDAPPVITNSEGQIVAGPNSMGVLTLEQGSVNIFTDRSLLLAQSRIFTEQGGNMVIWSSNGDINAGQGAKTVEVIPPPTYLCDLDAYCLINALGEVSGAGIATLQTIPGAAPGDVYLVAPRGTVDAGDAGIRVSGNLVVAAAQVLNAVNIQVQGSKVGVPVTQTVNVGALTAAGAAAGAVTKVAQDIMNQQQNDALSKLPSIISVQVLGFGDSSSSIIGSGSGYDPNSPVQVLGAGHLSEARKQALTESERQRLSE